MNTYETEFLQGHSISLYEDETPLIKKILMSRGIDLKCLDEAQNILNLSSSYVGFINTPHRVINLNPKHDNILLSHVMRIYFFVYGNYDNLNDEVYNIKPSEYYLNLANIYVNELEMICRTGLPVEYRINNKLSKYIQGSINYKNTYLNILLNNNEPFDCTVDELTYNNALNQILAAAFLKIRNSVRTNTNISNIQKHLSLIDGIDASIDIDKVTINRKNNYCKYAFSLAKMILKETYFENFEGSSIGECFLINFDKLFEDFIKKILLHYTNDFRFSFWNEPKEYGIYGEKIKKYQPDIMYNFQKKDNKAYAVIDVKNKTSAIFKNADVFQMLFYSTYLNSTKLILCYPSAIYKRPELLKIYSDGFKTNCIHAVFINICEEDNHGFKLSIQFFIDDFYKCF